MRRLMSLVSIYGTNERTTQNTTQEVPSVLGLLLFWGARSGACMVHALEKAPTRAQLSPPACVSIPCFCLHASAALSPCRPLLPCSALPRSLPSGLLRDIRHPIPPPVQHPHCPSGRVQPLVLLCTIILSPTAIVRPVASCHPLGRALLLLPSASIHRPSRSDLPLSPALLNPASAVPLTDDRASVELANLPCAPPRPLQRCAYCKTVCQHSQRIDPSLGRWRRPHRDCLDFRATPTALHSLLTTHATRPVLHAGLAV